MHVVESREGTLVRLDRGSEVVATFLAWAGERGLRGGAVRGLGAVRDAEIGYFDLETRTYQRRRFPEVLEVLVLEGNLALKEDALFLHAHVVLGRRDLSVVGGHLFAATVAVTLELMVGAVDLIAHRVPDPATGLWLLGEKV